MHHDDRVAIEPHPVRKGQNVTIKYKGLLVNSGADAVWLHYGYDGWQSSATVAMGWQSDRSCVATIPALGNREINFCFKDSASNWDNNSGWNWKCDIM
ncbi:MAG: hypothetical protein PWP65_933 [Clostridia bacterium]|nr:hypothetical protein [Clostridia bacterium]